MWLFLRVGSICSLTEHPHNKFPFARSRTAYNSVIPLILFLFLFLPLDGFLSLSIPAYSRVQKSFRSLVYRDFTETSRLLLRNNFIKRKAPAPYGLKLGLFPSI